jgi:peptide/nickel transport system permease protein
MAGAHPLSQPPASQPEGLRAWLLSPEPGSRWQARLGRLYLGWRAFTRNPLAVFGLGIIVLLVLVAAFADWLAPASPVVGGDLRTQRLLPPSGTYWFGTDDQARDILSRLIYGSRITLFVVVLVSIIAMPIGLLVGTVAGYVGGWVDTVLMRATDIFLAFPRLILALAFVAALGPGIENAVIAIAITSWPPYARIARAETLTIRNSDFIAAVKLQGASTPRIIFSHVVPLCMSSVIVRVTLDMAGIILTAAGLGFLGLGAQPPMPEWGAMVATGRNYLIDQWWVAAVPGLAIFVVSLGFNLLGDGLRDVLDPKAAK